MNISASIYSRSKKLAALVLVLSAVFSGTASAADIEESDPSAPCGELHLIGKENYIYNPSNFLFIVKFTTESISFVNAGAVKYFERDAKGTGFWRDTGAGDYRRKKTYNIPVKSHDTATIAYCAADSGGNPYISGEVSFSADMSQEWGNMPVDGVVFSGEVQSDARGWKYVRFVEFFNDGITPYVDYNRKPGDIYESGSQTLCPNDPFCQAP